MAWIEIRRSQHRVYWRIPTGKTYEPFTTRKAAQDFLALGEILDGDYTEARRLVQTGELARLFAHPGGVAQPAPTSSVTNGAQGYGLADVLAGHLPSRTRSLGRTKDDYRRDFTNHIAPYFRRDGDIRTINSGRYYLPGQRPDPSGAEQGTSVSGWLTWLESRHALTTEGKPSKRLLSAKTRRGLHGLLSGTLEFACMTDPAPLIARNPCAGSQLPDAEPPVMHFLTPWGGLALLHHLDGLWYVIVLFADAGGARQGLAWRLNTRDPTRLRTPWSRRLAG